MADVARAARAPVAIWLSRVHVFRRPSVENCLRLLGLGPAASHAQIRATFRRLAKEYHPDLRRDPEAAQRFIDIVRAYRVLEVELKLNDPNEPRRRCPRCGRYAELLDGADGRAGCVACLLGDTDRRRYLPLPVFVSVRHYSVLTLYGISLALAVAYVYAPQRTDYALASLAAALAGLVILAIATLIVRDAFRD